MIGRDNQNRIRWGNLLTLPVGQGGIALRVTGLRVARLQRCRVVVPAFDSRGDDVTTKVGYGPHGQHRLDGIFGPGAGATAAAGPGHRGRSACGCSPARGCPGGGSTTSGEFARGAHTAVAVPPPSGVPATLSPAKLLRCRGRVRDDRGARCSTERQLHQYGAALQRLDEAMTRFDSAK